MTTAQPSDGTAKQSVLLVEDDVATSAYTADQLRAAGWRVETAFDGVDGLVLAEARGFDVIIVDRMLPRLDGLSLVEQLRRRGDDTPVLFVTAMGAVIDRVAGLEGGGDDYLVKPYSTAEMNARVHALARRSAASRERTVLRTADLVLDRLARTVRRGDRLIDLLPLEFRLLEFLLLNAGRSVTRTMLLERVWGFNFDPRTNIVETHISRLRAKIAVGDEPALVGTVRGAGYLIAAS